MSDDKHLLDSPGTCFGWCKLPDDGTFNTSVKQAMCSCKCASWGAANMANHNNDWMKDLKIIKPKRKSQKHKDRKRKSLTK